MVAMRGHLNLDPRIQRALAVAILGSLVAMQACTRRTRSSREVWAEIDGEPLFRDQVERIYRSRTPAGSDGGDPEQALSFKLSILNELINNQILVAHASRSRITVLEGEVDTKLAELQSPYSKEEFQKRIRDQGLELSDLRQEIHQSITVNKLINKEISSRIWVTDAEIAAYYERNKSSFNVAETQYHVAQIQVTPVADPEVRNLKNDDAKSPRDAERKIQALYARLRGGEDFGTVAQEYSEDPRTASGGGDMGFIPVSSLNSSPQLKQVVTALKAGEFSGVYRDSTGFHIIKLLGKEEAGQLTPSEPSVKTSIRQALMNEKEQLLKAAYIEVLRNRAKVVNFLAQQIISVQTTSATSKR
jgi:peptidyl-prolyl cis-trans isomerase SurA